MPTSGVARFGSNIYSFLRNLQNYFHSCYTICTFTISEYFLLPTYAPEIFVIFLHGHFDTGNIKSKSSFNGNYLMAKDVEQFKTLSQQSVVYLLRII